MAKLRYSPEAEADIEKIVEYTLETWGEAQTSRYVNAIEDCCERLVETPMLGRTCDEIRPGLRRIGEGPACHIFYRQNENGIRVSRILHESMVPESRFMEGEP